MAFSLTEDHESEFREAFCLIDKDCDGFITMEELVTLVQALDENPSKEEVETLMHELGVDGNGIIDFVQFFDVMTRKMKENLTDELQEAFKVFDRDEDGYISAYELRVVMMNLGERLSDGEAEQMIKEADMDGDGQVSFEEFAKMIVNFDSLIHKQ